MIRTSGSMADGENWAELPASVVKNGTVTASLLPHSITTFLVESADESEDEDGKIV